MNDLLLFCELLPQRITRCNSDTGRRRLPSLCLSGNWSLHDGDTSPWGKRYKLWGQYKSVYMFVFFCFVFFCECHRRYNVDRAIFNWVSKIIRDCTGFALRRSVIGPGNLAPISQLIRCKTETNHDLVASVFQRFPALGSLVVFTLDSHWLLKVKKFTD